MLPSQQLTVGRADLLSQVELTPLTGLGQALQVAAIRNQVAHLMTNDQRSISPLQQARWYTRRYVPGLTQANPYRLWVVTAPNDYILQSVPHGRHGGVVLGYCGMQYQPEAVFITEGLHPEVQGQGLGRWLLTTLFATGQFDQMPIIADIFSDNVPSLRLHTRCGFVCQSPPSDTPHVARYVRLPLC
jgi:RimJ/RimL family protein N-acetyltransferase